MSDGASDPSSTHDIDGLFAAAQRGDGDAIQALLPMVYGQLRQIAQAQMGQERQGHTLQATALVHEVFLRMLGSREVTWENRARFFAAAAEAMRRILIDHARRRGRKKRAGDRDRVPLSAVDLALDADLDQVLALDEAMKRLAGAAPRANEVVRLRFFAGLSEEETAAMLGISPRTVRREWTFARAWLYEALREAD
jgi:RNA polymerase sigma factor (TIGR02999 family)